MNTFEDILFHVGGFVIKRPLEMQPKVRKMDEIIYPTGLKTHLGVWMYIPTEYMCILTTEPSIR